MKRFLFLVFLACTLLSSYGSTHALSFAPDTKFIDAQTQSECESLWGSFIEWYDEKYCTQPKSFKTFKDLIKVEPMCKVATDGCNTVQINNGELGAMTMMYCENIYGSGASEQWSCLDDKLEQDTIWFLPDEQQAEYKELKKSLGDKIVNKVSDKVSKFGDKVLNNVNFDTTKGYKIIDKAIAKIELHLMTSKYGNQKIYQSIQVLLYELKILKNRWEQNTGVMSN